MPRHDPPSLRVRREGGRGGWVYFKYKEYHMTNKLNIGLIGAGMIGDVHINNIRMDGRAEVTWIAARTQRTLDMKRKRFSIRNGTLDYKDMLRDSALDAVIIASPPHMHFIMLKDALAAGKDVLMEKPLALNRTEMDQTIQVVEQYPDQMVLECSCRHARLQPRFSYVKKMIESDKLGQIYHIHHNHLTRGTFIEYNPAGFWAHQKALSGGGPFMDWGVYDLSFHLGILNDIPQIRSVESFIRSGLKRFKDPQFRSDIEEHGAAYLTFDTGLTYYYERGNGVQAEIPNETRIFGTKGSVRFAFCSWDHPEIELYTYDQNGNEISQSDTFETNEDIDDNFELTKHFLDCLQGKSTPQMTPQLAAKHLDILFRILNPT